MSYVAAAEAQVADRIFRWLWCRWLVGAHLVRVTGWRSCLLERAGTRERVVFCGPPWRRR